MTLFSIIILSTLWFLILVSLQRRLPWKFCAMCVAVTSTWLLLLLLRLAGFMFSPLFIGVLMGESIVGFMYLAEKKLPPRFQIFRWPFLITLTVLVYILLGERQEIYKAVGAIVLFWVAAVFMFFFRHDPRFKKAVDRLIACCRNW